MNPRYAPVLFGFLVSGLMSFIVSGVATLRALGPTPEMLGAWLPVGWFGSWAVAFPAILLVAPLARRLVARMVREAPRTASGLREAPRTASGLREAPRNG